MKKLLLLFALLPFAFLAGTPAAEPAKTGEAQKQVLALVKEVQAQQLVMAENQTKIDNKIAAIAEQVRVARIYSSRTGR